MKINSFPATLAFGLGIFIARSLFAEASSHSDSHYEIAFKAIRNGDVKHLPALLNDSRVLERRDATGTPLLMHAAFYLDAAGLKLLLDKGADPNGTNKTGASALMWAAADPEKVRLLLRGGADVHAVSSRGNTPLTAAAFQYGSASVLRQLLEAGADINACNNDGDTSLIAAARMGDCEALRVLIEHKADVGKMPDRQTVTHVGGNALMNAAVFGHLDVAKLLINNGADVNEVCDRGNALHWAALTDRREVADFLLRSGINVNVSGTRLHSFRNDRGYTPLMYAAMTERDDPALVNAMIKNCADVNARSAKGESALDFASQRGKTRIVSALLKVGAKQAEHNQPNPPRTLRQKEEAANPDAGIIKKSVEGALDLLIRSGTNFSDASANRCFSCHQQTLPAIALGLARERGFVYDAHLAGEQWEDTLRLASRRRDEVLENPLPVPSIAALLLLALHASGYEPNTVTDAYVYSLARSQFQDGRWITSVARAPTDYSDITSTALALHALQLYAPPKKKHEYARRVDKAASWLRGYRSQSTEERALQLLGLYWAGASHAELSKLGQVLIKDQRSDGGWGQLPTLESDAYATGETLFALNVAGCLDAKEPTFLRAMKFLLATQYEDSSWFVRTRAFPVQKAMDKIFPHGNDQWISSSATSWACMALMLSERSSAPRRSAALNIKD